MDEEHGLYTAFNHCNGSSSECNHMIQLEYMNGKYREVLNQLKSLERERDHLANFHGYNNALEDTYTMRSETSRYKILVEELTKERNELQYEVATVLSERGTVLKENQKLYDKNDNLVKELDKMTKECGSLKEKLDVARNRNEFMPQNDEISASKDKMAYLSLSGANQEIERLKKSLDKVKTELSKAIEESELAKTRRDQAISEREKIVNERDSVRNLCDELRKERDSATSNLLAAIRDKDEAFKKIEQLHEKLEAKKVDHHETSTPPVVSTTSTSTKDFKNSANALNRYSKMVNSCTQTENYDGKRSVENSFLQIVPFVPSLGGSNNIDSPPTPSDMQILNNSISISSSSPNSSKSTSAKFSGMFQRFRDKFTNNSSNNKENDENDALAKLDSVLDSQDSLEEDISPSNSKKSRKKSKNELAKSWPRAAMVIHDPKSHSGTVVVSRKKERPRLFDISVSPKSVTSNEDDKNDQPDLQAMNSLFNPPPPINPPVMRTLNRNSNPLPIATLNHQFLGRGGNVEKIPPRTTTNTSSWMHDPPKIHNKNRYSLNINTMKPQHFQQQSVFMPIKNSNSIESKSPIELGMGIGMSGMEFQNSQKMNKYFHNYLNMNSNKYDCASDNENFSSSGGVSNNDSLNNNSTNTLPSHMMRQGRSHGNYPAGSGSGSGMSSLYNSQQHSNPSSYRYASPIPFTPPGPLNMYEGNLSSLHSHNSSIEYHFPRQQPRQLSREEALFQEGGTFPRKKDATRFRNQQQQQQQQQTAPHFQNIPPLGKPTKISNNSLDYCGTPDRASPMPTFQVQILSPGRNMNKRNSMPEYRFGIKPNVGELRRVHIDKSEKPLGIKIRCRNNGGGVFVCNVGENSIARQVGLQIGDQLLEVCGINMRSATYELAASVLRQCGNSITMLVQYLPDKYEELSTSDENISRSDDSTPQNSPKAARSILSPDSSTSSRMQPQNQQQPPQESSHSTQTLKSQRSALSAMQPSSMMSSNNSNNVYGKEPLLPHMSNSSTLGKEPVRKVYIETRKCPNLGISLLGGNAYGIFIHSVHKDSIAESVGLRVGDQILEYNGKDLRRATAEYAAFELAKPADKVMAVVQYNIHKFNQIKDKPGDSFYIRVGFDRNSELNESELQFAKDDVLYVDNTMFRGVSGLWRAWKLDEYGHRLVCGIIPSQIKVEEELRTLGDSTDDTSSSRRSSTSARRSFFKRIKPQRGSSRDSKELASFSNTHLSLFLESNLNEDGQISYQRVERLDYKYRPVIVIGALSEWVVDKLIIDFPEQFHRCIVNQMKCSKEEIEMRLKNNSIIEYRRRGSLYECVSLQAVKDNKISHCILDVNITAVERLHRNQVYPIVLLLRFKSAKQIKEIKDSRYSTDKLSAKQAKEMYEHAMKLESEYKQYVSVVIPAGVNITHMSTQIKAAVDTEQKKILWIPT